MSDYPNEVYECAEWITATINADTGAGGLKHAGAQFVNGVFMDMVPEDVDLPAIRFHVHRSEIARALGRGHATRILTRLDWLIVVMNMGHLVSPLVPIVQRLDTVLTGASGSTSLVTIDACEMIEPFQMLETDKTGVQIRHAGGIYRTIVVPK